MSVYSLIISRKMYKLTSKFNNQTNLSRILRCSRCLSATAISRHHYAHHQTLDTHHLLSSHYSYHMPIRWMSGKKGFFGEFIENIKQDFDKNKEMKENLQKFREEKEKLEQSEALQKAREKYESIESETAKGTEVLKEKLEVLQGKVKEGLDEVSKTDVAKKGQRIMSDVGKTAQKTAEAVSKQSEQITQSQVFKSVSKGVKSVKEEIDETAFSRANVYKAPEKLRKREEDNLKPDDEKPIEANEDATGVVMHKDSKWFQSWQNFRENNQFVHKMFDMKTKYDESENIMIRATRTFTDKVTDIFGGVFSTTEMSAVLTEIVKMDPTFNKEKFIKDCQVEMIPNILEAMVRGDLIILKDWCHEAAYNTIAHPIQQAQKAGYKMDSKVLDINHVDIAAGQIMEQGPVLVISFYAQQIMAVRNSSGRVMEGDPDKILKVFHVWAFCRDQSILNPNAAWRLIDLSSSPAEQWL